MGGGVQRFKGPRRNCHREGLSGGHATAASPEGVAARAKRKGANRSSRPFWPGGLVSLAPSCAAFPEPGDINVLPVLFIRPVWASLGPEIGGFRGPQKKERARTGVRALSGLERAVLSSARSCAASPYLTSCRRRHPCRTSPISADPPAMSTVRHVSFVDFGYRAASNTT